MTPDISQLPDEARLWIFGADRPLEPAEIETLHEELARFLRDWAAHRVELVAGFAIDLDRFVLVAVDEERAAASGCSIDALLRALAGLEERLGVGLRDGRLVFHREPGGGIVACDRAEFRRRAASGRVDADTRVFDLTVDRLGTWRESGIERPAGGSWHARLFPTAPRVETTRSG